MVAFIAQIPLTLSAKLSEPGPMRVRLAGNFQAGRIKTIHGPNAQILTTENASHGPGIKLSRKCPV